MMQIVHEDVEVPFLPYLGRLALMAIEDRDDQDAVYSTCSHLYTLRTTRFIWLLGFRSSQAGSELNRHVVRDHRSADRL